MTDFSSFGRNGLVRLELARDSDLGTVCELLSAASRRMAEQGLQFWWDPFPPEEVQRSITRQETFLVLRGSEVIGTIAVAWEDISIWGTGPPDAGYVHRLAIAPDATSVGLGTMIIDMAGSFIANKGRRWIRLDTMAPDNGPRASLHRWYTRQGFVKVGEVDAPIVGEHGQLISYRTILYERPASNQ